MMETPQKIPPRITDIWLEYVCPFCGLSSCLTPKQSLVGHIICQYCDSTYEIIPFKYSLANIGSSNSPIILHQETVNLNLEKIQNSLVGIGITKRKAKDIVMKAMSMGYGESDEKLLKECLTMVDI